MSYKRATKIRPVMMRSQAVRRPSEGATRAAKIIAGRYEKAFAAVGAFNEIGNINSEEIRFRLARIIDQEMRK